MWVNPFLNSDRQVRQGWWIVIFFLLLALLLFPILILSDQYGREVSPIEQALLIIVVSWICQLLRQKPLTEIIGKPDINWLKEFLLGSLIGSIIMLVPAIILIGLGLVRLEWASINMSMFISIVVLFIGVALAEELIFRGFIFQRLIAGLGEWPAQLILAGYFLLTHLNNPGMVGSVKILASVNIFLASIMFGLAFLRTQSLAMPIGLHFMANLMQGGLLGFGVSGTNQSGLFKPIISKWPEWLTGGEFGLEATILGLICVTVTVIFLYKWPTKHSKNLYMGK